MPIDWLVALEGGAIFSAGFLAGGINVIVGAGTLVSFPILVLLGFPPLTATIANTIGIVPGSVSGVVVYRRELRANTAAIRMLLPASTVGAIAGVSLLLRFSADVFSAVVPWLITIGTVLVIAGPVIKRRISHAAPKTPVERPRLKDDEPFPNRPTLVVSIAGAFFLGI